MYLRKKLLDLERQRQLLAPPQWESNWRKTLRVETTLTEPQKMGVGSPQPISLRRLTKFKQPPSSIQVFHPLLPAAQQQENGGALAWDQDMYAQGSRYECLGKGTSVDTLIAAPCQAPSRGHRDKGSKDDAASLKGKQGAGKHQGALESFMCWTAVNASFKVPAPHPALSSETPDSTCLLPIRLHDPILF